MEWEKAKPILFSTKMVQAILDELKTHTRRVIKQVRAESDIRRDPLSKTGFSNAHGYPVKPRYSVGDILYVRETCWIHKDAPKPPTADTAIYYETDLCEVQKEPGRWLRNWYKKTRSIHMPRAAARIFLCVTGVRAGRIQDISEADCVAEGAVDPEAAGQGLACFHQGIFSAIWDELNAKPKPIKSRGVITHYESYPWEDITETREYRGKPWYVIGNPWVWVYEFERVYIK